MRHPYIHRPNIHRRKALQQCALGFGSLALASLMAGESNSASPSELVHHTSGLHHPARAKRVIFLFMKGGPSHVDTFDFKPSLQRDDGKELPFAKPRVQFAPTGKLLASPGSFSSTGSVDSASANCFLT